LEKSRLNLVKNEIELDSEMAEIINTCIMLAIEKEISYLSRPIIFYEKRDKIRWIVMSNQLDNIKLVKNAVKSTKPEWMLFMSFPNYRDKPCLYVEVVKGDKSVKYLFDPIVTGDDYFVEPLLENPILKVGRD